MKRLKLVLLLMLLAVLTSPLLQAQTVESFTFTTNRVVPDGNYSGMSDVQTITSTIGSISSVKVRLKVTGEFNGDLYAYLRHSSGFTVLLNRPGKSAANPIGYGDDGFDITLDDAALNDLHTYQTATVPPNGSPLTGTWLPDGRNVDPDLVTDADPQTTSLANFAGLNASGRWTLYVVDTQSGATNMLTEWGLDITGAAGSSLSWPNPADIVYGTALSDTQLNASVLFNSTNVPGTFVYTPPLGTVLNAGSGQTLSVTFIPNDSGAFLPITKQAIINVQKAPLTITAVDANKVYGEVLPVFTAAYDGFVNGDTVGILTTAATLGTTATAASPVGDYSITASGAASPNYAFDYTGGTLTITQAHSTGSVATSANPALPGASVTFTATLNAVAPGAGAPDGTVNFRVDGAIAGSGTLSGGIATFSTSTLTHGSHTVTAEYAGSVNFIGTTNALGQSEVINTPPVANDDTIERYPTQSVKVRLSTLLANDSDADGDTLTATVSTLSANGGSVVVTGGWVIYTPATGFTSADSFTYSIDDGHGATTTATVHVVIQSDNQPGANLSITALGGNSFRIEGSGIPGRTYRLQYSNGDSNWQDLTNATADGIGFMQFTNDSTETLRFYRTVTP